MDSLDTNSSFGDGLDSDLDDNSLCGMDYPHQFEPALQRPSFSRVPRVQSEFFLNSSGNPSKRPRNDCQLQSSSILSTSLETLRSSNAFARPAVGGSSGLSQRPPSLSSSSLQIPSPPSIPQSLRVESEVIEEFEVISDHDDASHVVLQAIPKARSTLPRGTPKAGVQDVVNRASKPSMSPVVRTLWLQVFQIYGQFSSLLSSLEFSSNADAHIMRILDGFAPSTTFKYFTSLIKIWRFLCDMRLDLHNLTALQLADCLMGLETRSSIKAMRWGFNKLQIQCFQVASDPLVDSFLKDKTPIDRREALPLPLIVLVQWERRVLQGGTPLFEVVILGFFLFMAWSGLRWADMQRTYLHRLRYDSNSLRGVSWRAKTHTQGLPFGFLSKGFLSRGMFNWVERWLRVLDSLYPVSVFPSIDFVIPGGDGSAFHSPRHYTF